MAPNEAEVEALIDAHNRERSSASPPLPPLVRNQKLEAAALAQARDMARHETLSHESRDGSTLPQRVERQRYSYRGIAENIAYGPTESSKVLQMWMLSAPHRKNLMGDYSDVGVARVDSSKGVPYWAVVFGKPKAQSSP